MRYAKFMKKKHAVEKGLDVTERTLIAFGGGAPLHLREPRQAHGLGLLRKHGRPRIPLALLFCGTGK